MGLNRLVRWCYRHGWLVLGFWLAALVIIQALAALEGGSFAANFHLPGTESQQVADLLEERFPTQAGDSATIVVRADAGVAAEPVRARLEPLFGEVATLPHVLRVDSPYSPGMRSVSADGHIAFATVQFDVRGRDLPPEVVSKLEQLAEAKRGPGLQIELGGQVIRLGQRSARSGGELFGLLAAASVLVLTFGSLVAASLPLLVALCSVGLGLGLVTLLARAIEVPDATPQLALMIGLGVGIDYALLIITRFRQERQAGRAQEEAALVALGTAGRAVLFAGATVVVSVLGLLLMGLDLLRGLASGTALVVLLSMVASTTLLPAALGLLGGRIDSLSLPQLRRRQPTPGRSLAWRWSRLVQRHPWPAALGALVVLVVLAVPVFSIHLGVADAGSDPTSRTSRRAYDLLAEGFGPGFNGPLVLAVDLEEDPAGEPVLNRLTAALRAAPGIAGVGQPVLNEAKDTAVIAVVPKTAPQDQATEELIDQLRAELLPRALSNTGVWAGVGGITATYIDLSQSVGRRLPLVLGMVIGVSFLLLLLVFRSVLVPLKAALMNLLSIGAAYGVLVAVFQWGWLKGLVGVDKTGPIEAYLPLMLFAILFGLSMDYEVFLLSRVQEEYKRSGDNALAVADGLASTAGVITAAAAIMVTVFLAFVFGDSRMIKLAGLGLASAIFLDATLVRMVLVPATMELLGRANWWFPVWLDRRLPVISLGEAPAESPARLLDPATDTQAESASASVT